VGALKKDESRSAERLIQTGKNSRSQIRKSLVTVEPSSGTQTTPKAEKEQGGNQCLNEEDEEELERREGKFNPNRPKLEYFPTVFQRLTRMKYQGGWVGRGANRMAQRGKRERLRHPCKGKGSL